MYVFVMPTDESSGEEGVIEATKEECELGMVKSWMEVRGLLMLVEEEEQKLLQEVYPLCLILA